VIEWKSKFFVHGHSKDTAREAFCTIQHGKEPASVKCRRP